ncbi:MAG: gamma carbonic anhydrase family protein [Alphaproteobacteria bacterium]|nr:gamma carbonic anhydrase family protein [Alphaproteobacteria bacterium]MBU6471144.1 gamma carbonic anhydrase family protein [Alphaproteobacteria bacterium]MDE2013099.1 gamma carbonic anhydrase family protein [Alphaproteobacteria bacterium]MDE2074394.1 gamma carbonic anhydrase family protein [Alphaproteobacteria bacterium]MDE2351919.1 gamma carbonic anhydrase family protein [Alphaproteobacteria bacterium]
MPIYALEGVKPELPASNEHWIAPDAVLIGRVRLLKNASIWFGCVLRGDTEWITIGENSNIQDNSVIHADMGQPTEIGANVTVGHRAIVHAAFIGDNTLIGMGATVLNRARVGRNCLIGAHALIGEDKVIPDGSLVLGAPGRVVRTLSEEEIFRLKMSADLYVANHRRFRDNLERLD